MPIFKMRSCEGDLRVAFLTFLSMNLLGGGPMNPMQISPRLSSFSGNSITFTCVSLSGPRFALGVSKNGRFQPGGLSPRF